MKWCHIGIKAKDSESSIRFYREILGLAIVDTVDVWGKKFTFVGNDTIQIEIEQANPGDIQADPSTMTGLNHFSVVVNDIHRFV
ncbi:MAG: VOC family protein, partial [Smithellaceae bacterium]|nr:VOC family protein [Smithellaceae bacterium]